LPTFLFILPDGHADRCPSRKNLIPSYWVGSLDRLPTDVHACDTIRIRFEVAAYAPEVSPVLPIVSGNVSASWACLARVFGWNLQYGYAELRGLVCECVAEESVWYPVRLSSTLATHLPFSSSELVEPLDGDACIVLLGQISQLFGEQPSVCANIASLSPTEPFELESCFASMSVLVSVLLQHGAAVFVADLSQRDVASKVELPQNPAIPLVHHGDSNAIGVLVHADHALRDLWGWRILLEQHEETVAAGHQNACGNPTVCQVFLQADVCAVSLDWKPEPFMVRSDAEDMVSAPCATPREETFVKPYCRMLNLRGDLASLPSVPLGFLNQLASYPSTFVLSIDHVVQCSVCVWLRDLHSLKREGRDRFEGCIGFTELPTLKMRQRCKVEPQRLLRRYLPQQTHAAPNTLTGQLDESVPQFLPRINSWVSLRCFL